MNWRAAWASLWRKSLPIMAEPDDPFAAHRRKGVSELALAEASRTGAPVPLPETTFARYQPMQGVVPSGIAMDSAFPPINGIAAYTIQGVAHEGLAFLGYPYLAELTQRPEYRRASEIRAEHATRKWIKLAGPDDAKLAALDAEMKRLEVKERFRWALEYDGFMGRSQLFMDFGDFDRETEIGRRKVAIFDQRHLTVGC